MTSTQRTVKCHPYFQMRAKHPQTSTWTMPALAKAYDFPTGLTGNGVIAIVELGGGWVASDMQKYFAGIGQPVPMITDVSVDGTGNSLQNPRNDADYEVALDIEVAAAAFYLAAGKPAVIRVYWSQDIATAVIAAAKDGCAACGISWGADEASWGKEAAEQMEAAAIAATAAGMVIFAASGDNDSSDGGPTSANVDCPASCPHVIGCGGTSKTLSAETVWNDNPGKTNGEGTGGGYSMFFPVQASQIGAPVAPKRVTGDKNPGTGRMVPDVAANADPNTGYIIVCYGQELTIGGTSAVAPLYAGLFAAFGSKLGFITPKLYLNQGAFTDIWTGSNGDYSAAKGPDPCSGIGVVIGTKLAVVLG
jgi:kumamolisin